jgi:hypothetical protein
MLYKDYNRNVQLENKIIGHESQVACHQVILTQLLVSIRLRGFCTEGCEDST